ncbi:MAG TPA: metallophosphoesterase, partial [Acidisoma sp.]|uniref:metallophosphoesterase family protein n=1 Tax=Acidisoma sp. TaxID=1872115 RepID=UPI002D08D157
RTFMECAGWIGAGMLWTVTAGVPRTIGMIGAAEAAEIQGGFTFLQMSDSHIGFKAGPYQDVAGTLQQAVSDIRKLPARPQFMLHTGDISHLAREDQFDTADQIYAQSGLDIHHVPGEHDILDPGKRLYLARYGKNTKGEGWYSFDDHGLHFIGLSNVFHNGADGQWLLGADQIAWLTDDLRGVASSTPVVVFAHVPLWTVYAKWGWGTGDVAAVLPLFRRFGSVTVLNGHIHQIVQKVEGRLAYHTARSTAFPQPAPGKAPHSGPIMTIPAGAVGEYLGMTTATVHAEPGRLAITDTALS